VDKRAPASRGQFVQRRLAAPRGLDQLLGDEFAAFVIAAVRKLTAYSIKYNVHIGLSPFVEFVQIRSSSAAPWAKYRDGRRSVVPAGPNRAITTFSRK
jgi:hypothetical protein